MKKRTAAILLGMVLSVSLFSGCGETKEATEAANESEATEKEGQGEELPEDMKEKEDKEEEETSQSEEEPKGKVGILFPSDETEERWSADAQVLSKELNAEGYDTEICYAKGDTSLQVSQLQELLKEEVSALIIAPSDPYGLSDILAEAKEKSIPVFSYDTLIMDTDAVKYYVTFDMRRTGQMIGENIVKTKELEKAREHKESRSIEFIMGSPDDRHSLFLYNGIMEVLQSYLDDGTLVCRSQKTSFDETSVMRWSESAAEADLRETLDNFYQDETVPDIICTATDGFAQGALRVMEERAEETGGVLPYITGLGSEAEAVRKVAGEKIGFTVFLDRRTLAEKCAEMVLVYLSGEKPEVTDYEQYDNGKKIIGTCTCGGELIDKDNYEMLVDNGAYTEEEVTPNPEDMIRVETEEAEEEQEPVEESEPAMTPAATPEPSKKPGLLAKTK